MIAALRSVRALSHHWKLTAIAAISLAVAMALGILGLGVSNTILFLPPAAPAPDRLVMIYSRSAQDDIGQFSYPDYQYYRAHNHVFLDIAAAPNSIDGLSDFNFEGRAVNLMARPVSGNYFSVLGIRPFLGRMLVPGDDDNAAKTAVMTYSCWKRLGSDPKIVGKVAAGQTIVGVASPSFTGGFYGFEGDLFTSLGGDADPWKTKRTVRRLPLIARLRTGVTRQQAQAEMTALAGQLASAYPKEDKGVTAVVTRATLLPPDAISNAQILSAIVMGLVLLVLVIACANVANLLLAIAVGRRQEAAIKLALGAPRGRLVREFLAGSTALCTAGGILGYLLAEAAMRWFSRFTIPFPVIGSISFALHLRLDGTVALLSVFLILIASLVTGLAPALYASSPSLAQMLSGEIVVGGTRGNARRNLLVIIQVAVCTLVLVGVGLCQRNIYNLRHTDLGFSARNLVANTIYVEGEGYDETRGKALYGTVLNAISALPGVESAALTAELPPLGAEHVPVQRPDGSSPVSVGHGVVDTGYFATLGLRIESGRAFTSSDRADTAPVAIINRKMASMFWPDQDPVGKSFRAGEPARAFTVVGVAATGKYLDLDEEPQPFFYFPLTQHYQRAISVIARTKGDPSLWVQPMAKALRGVGLKVLVQPVTLENWLTLALLTQRVAAACVAILSGIALLLALLGLFGAISYSVSQRTKELGIRVALGALPLDLLRLIVRQTMFVAGTGVAIGILLGVAATILFQSQLYGIRAVEWTVLLPVCAAMLPLCTLVAALSARPWLSADPMEAVRHA